MKTHTMKNTNPTLTTPFDRVLLHVLAMLRHGRVAWHVAGIRREFNFSK